MLESLAFVAGIAGVEYLALRFGKSTRDGEDWSNPSGPHIEVS